jgi:uncharacterized protein
MPYLWATLVTLLNVVWLALVALGLPGTWLMVATAAGVAWWQAARGSPNPLFSLWTLIAATALAALGEFAEFAAGAAGARRTGATKRGARGALIGGLVGALLGTAIPVPVIGSLLGAGAGAAIGAAFAEFSGGRRVDDSLRAGVGAGIGRLAGSLVKLVIGALIWLELAVAAFWP